MYLAVLCVCDSFSLRWGNSSVSSMHMHRTHSHIILSSDRWCMLFVMGAAVMNGIDMFVVFVFNSKTWNHWICWRRAYANAFADYVFIDQGQTLGDRRRSDIALDLTLSNADNELKAVNRMYPPAFCDKANCVGPGWVLYTVHSVQYVIILDMRPASYTAYSCCPCDVVVQWTPLRSALDTGVLWTCIPPALLP